MFDEASFCCDCTELTRLKNYFLEVRSCALQVGMQLHFYVTERARVCVPFFDKIFAKVVSGYNLQFHRKMTQVYCDSF